MFIYTGWEKQIYSCLYGKNTIINKNIVYSDESKEISGYLEPTVEMEIDEQGAGDVFCKLSLF